jgi:hypothetical protein
MGHNAMSDNRSESDKLREEIAAAAKARAATPKPPTRDELLANAHQRFQPLWEAVAEYHEVANATPGHSVAFTFTEVDLTVGIVKGQITFQAGGSRQRLHLFTIQGRGIWVPAFKHKVNNRDFDMYHVDELQE